MSGIEVLLDTREQDLISKLKVPFTTTNLEVGDILYRKDGQNILLIERKTYADLANAIPTGRHHEQKARIHAFECRIKSYLIEEPTVVNNRNIKIPQTTLDSAVLGLIIRDGLYVFHSRDLNMTCQIISKIYEKLDTYLKERNEALSGNLKYTGPIYSIRKENLNPESCYLAQLACYPGISNKIANDILYVYRNFSALLKATKEDLSGLQIISEDVNSKKKLGVIGERLWDYLHHNDITLSNVSCEIPVIPKKVLIVKKQ